ncbi:MAG TPA: choice-of-anchor L domain-containing protein [Kofleriaceae bacterium]|nr:choice-of-anchor L domain-containing protein [Kofleriaceae bacterium]
MRCFALLAISSCALLAACGPTSKNGAASCNPGATQSCYTGAAGTEGVGPCKGGTETCTSAGQWGDCQNEVVPGPEICGNNIDDNCNGMTDEDVDEDGDGWTTCGGDCCDDESVCSDPVHVNPGAFDVPGDGVDNDCDGGIDNAVLVCDQGITSTTTSGMDFAKAIDLCQTTTMADPMRRWGVIDATFSLASGSGSVNAKSHAVLAHYGTGVMPHNGNALMLISTGNAAGKGDPNYDSTLDGTMGTSSAFPADWLSANGGQLPNAPGCPKPMGNTANDPVMLTLHVRVPTNAQSFSMDVNFFSDEFPEWTCSPYNDFFVVLLDSMYTGMMPNPADKNLAFYTDASMNKYPVGVNLAFGNTGLFTQCLNGTIGCDGTSGSISTCTGTTELTDTGLDQPAPLQCDTNSIMGGGTGWLTTSGNVQPGEIMTLRIAIWDTSDHDLDSMAVIDDFKWSATPANPGTTIFRQRPGLPVPVVQTSIEHSAQLE